MSILVFCTYQFQFFETICLKIILIFFYFHIYLTYVNFEMNNSQKDIIVDETLHNLVIDE